MLDSNLRFMDYANDSNKQRREPDAVDYRGSCARVAVFQY
jgi:hypothetical protein